MYAGVPALQTSKIAITLPVTLRPYYNTAVQK